MRHVIFVDDQPEVLAGLRRMMRTIHEHCRTTFVDSGSAALAILERDPCDVIVADMRMPGMDGATLLRQVRGGWPDTVRIILSGYTDESAALRSVAVAHRFVSKPCDTATLISTVRGACGLQDRLSDPVLRNVIGGLGTLPSAPRSFSAITEVLGEPEATPGRIAEVIERDPACSAKVLQLVNSAFFGLAHPVSQVRQAVIYLGISRIRDVVLATEISETLRCASPAMCRLAEAITAYSIDVARQAQIEADAGLSSDAFATGVLHDVGRMLLGKARPELYGEVERRRLAGEPMTVVEREILGVDHAEAGAYLLRLWGLPLAMVEAVATHHDSTAPEGNPLASALWAAIAVVESETKNPDKIR